MASALFRALRSKFYVYATFIHKAPEFIAHTEEVIFGPVFLWEIFQLLWDLYEELIQQQQT